MPRKPKTAPAPKAEPQAPKRFEMPAPKSMGESPIPAEVPERIARNTIATLAQDPPLLADERDIGITIIHSAALITTDLRGTGRKAVRGALAVYVDDDGAEHAATIDEVMANGVANLHAPSIPQIHRASGVPFDPAGGPSTWRLQ